MTSVTNQLNAQRADLLFMVEHAIKAPSGHNTQPWKFKINEHSVDIYPDYGKALPVVDPDNRELFDFAVDEVGNRVFLFEEFDTAA